MRKLSTVILTAATAGLAACAASSSVTEERLKVLYVGQNPDTVEGYTYGGDYDYNAELNKTRAQDFMTYLSEHFDTKLVYGDDFDPAMSDDFDVTIIDALPRDLEGKDVVDGERDPYASPFNEYRWLPEDFDAATIFVAGTVANIGPDVSLKMTTLCHCLGRYAFNVDTDHPIFNTPNIVELSYEELDYAAGVYHYYSGLELPASTPMWRVGTEDVDGNPYPPGHVSNPGVHDSPDAEVISGGVSIKSVNAVAIARHGSFLAWGFRQSPSFMTDEAKLAFINAVHYIAPFAGAERIVVPVSAHRLAALDGPYLVSDQGWSHILKLQERVRLRYEEALARVNAGTASEDDEVTVKFSKPREPVRANRLYSVPEDLRAQIGDDWNGYLEYYISRKDYLFAEDGYSFDFDGDAETLGIRNDDPALLERSIERLESGEDSELARRVLTRYTNKDFATAAEWRAWYEDSGDRLFFTELGGYKFIVDNREEEGRDPGGA